MATRKFVKIGSNQDLGNGYVSSQAILDVVLEVVQEMPNIDTNYDKKKVSSTVNVLLDKNIAVSISKDGDVNIGIRVKVRKNENATQLCKEIQERIMDDISSFIELNKCKVDVRIDGMF